MRRTIYRNVTFLMMVIFLTSCRLPAPPQITIATVTPSSGNITSEAVLAPGVGSTTPTVEMPQAAAPEITSEPTTATSTQTASPEITPAITEIVPEAPPAVQALAPLTTTVVTTPTVAANSAATPQPAIAQSVSYQFGLQPGTPVAMQYFANPELGCNWTGVAGQVFGKDGTPLNQVVIEVGGTLEGKEILQIALTTEATTYGPGGYEVTLADHPVASQGTLHIQLKDLTGKPISDTIPFDTYSACEKNLIMINLVESSGNTTSAYLPFISPKPATPPIIYLPLVHRR